MNEVSAARSDGGKTSFQHLVVMADGEVRVPPYGSAVAHGHKAPDQHIKIVMPANKSWLLLEVEVELEQAESPGNQDPAAVIANG
jgi:hypothetical protein